MTNTTALTAQTVLLVEDDEDLVALMQTILESADYTVRSALNGCEALADIQRNGIPGLILLDMKMPVMSGWEFASKFNARYDHEAPIVVVTASENARERAAEVAAAGWLGKPFDLSELLTTVETHIRH